MSPPNRQDVLQISKELGIYCTGLYQWSSNWRLQRDLGNRHQLDQKEIKALKQDLRRKEKALSVYSA